MPLPDTYRRALDSDVADLNHIAPGVGGGAVTAALFLREFVGERRWAHLDIAGTGRSDVDAGELRQGSHRVRDTTAAAVAGGDGMNAGYGLTVRWSLEDAPSDAADQLREYVVGTSIARFMFLDGLAFKVWRMREGEWFEGTYVFDSEQDRTLLPRGLRARRGQRPRQHDHRLVAGAAGGLGGRRDRRGPGGLPARRRPGRQLSRAAGQRLTATSRPSLTGQQRRARARRGRAATCRGRAACWSWRRGRPGRPPGRARACCP